MYGICAAISHVEPVLVDTKALIPRGELEFIKKWILDYPDLETGDFSGYWTSEGIQ